MAPQRIQFLIGDRPISLSQKVIKSYLPRLWRSHARYAVTTGYLDLEEVVAVHSEARHIALLIVLNALQASETQLGVPSELKHELTHAMNHYAGHKESPEPLMSRIFTNVARYLHLFSRHQEMTYAMSDWFTIYAAENHLSSRRLFDYVIALDFLGADMTAPLHSFLRRTRLTSADLHSPHLRRYLRPKTLKKLRTLYKDHKKELKPARNRLIAGGDLDLEEIVQQYLQDPDSIVVNPAPSKRHGCAHDDLGLCPCAHTRQPALLAPPPRIPGPSLLEHPGRSARPNMHRFNTFPSLDY